MNDIVLPSTHPTPDELLRATRDLALVRRDVSILSQTVENLTGKLAEISARLEKLEADAHNHVLPTKEVPVEVPVVSTPASEKKTTRKTKAKAE